MTRAITLATRLELAVSGPSVREVGACRPLSSLLVSSSSRRRLTAAANERRKFSTHSSKHQHYDVVIAGGGSVGSVLARLLLDDGFGSISKKASHRRPLKVALLEQRSSPPSLENLINGKSSKTKQTPNPRAYALSPASLSYLGPSVLQSLVRYNRCGIYDAMQIWEHDGPAQLHFVGEDLKGAIEDKRLVDLASYLNGSTQTRKRPWLGAVVEDAPLVSCLWDELKNDDRIDLLDNIQIKSIRAPPPSAVGNIEPPSPVQLSYTRSNEDTGDCTVSTNLLVAADGANSLVRRTVGNFPMMTRSYGRKAVTCTVKVESGMTQTAFQRFLPHGPIALLPVWNSSKDDDDASMKKGQNKPIYANVVWSTTHSEADYLLSLSPSEFTSVLNHHLCQGPNVNPSLLPNSNQDIPLFTTIAKEMDSLLRTANTALTMGTWTESPSRNYFRTPPKSIGVVSPILGFDLTMSHVVTSGHGSKGKYGGYTSPRVALVGDAAHTMHPMAGQGLNLGVADVNSLAKLIKEAVDSGMDVGGTNLFLDRYNEDRLLKGWVTVGGVHGLHEIFGCSGSVPGSVADGTYDSGRGSARGLERLIGYSRSLGMNVVNGLPIVRRALAEFAAGALPKGFN
jgi:ubiquinone biosynthesis monooxygenase Coq6